MRSVIIFIFIVSFLGSMGCGSTRKRSIEGLEGGHGSQGADLGEPFSSGDELSENDVISNHIPVVVNSKVKHWVHYFRNRGRRHMEKYLRRSTRYEKLMKKILREEGVPEDLIYVPLIESGFSSHAHSHRSAVGYWQFIQETGRRYGLKINRYVDERRDPLLSTKAAAAYFRSLYSLFGDWYLALAAYNTGENRVKRAVMREGTRDFWTLARKRRLHRETRNYVPKFLAAMLISKNPRKYGFTDVNYNEPLEYGKVYTTHPVSLLKLSRHMGVGVEKLRKLNSRYRTNYIPIYRGKRSLIRVPKGYVLAAHQALGKSHSKAPRYVPSSGKRHIVRRGDTLSGIALKYRVRTSDLRALNNLGRRSLIRVGQGLKIGRARRSVAQSRKKVVRSRRGRGAGYYVVRRGDTLSEIAQRHGVSISHLKRINRIKRSSFLRIGQKLLLSSSKGKGWGKSSRQDKGLSIHVVRKGDTLWDLSQKYKVSLRRLRAVNSLSMNSKLQIGKSLIIP